MVRQLVRIAVDIMGGDYAPDEIVNGAVLAAQRGSVEIILVGPLSIICTQLSKHQVAQLPISCIGADEFVSEDESPVLALRRKSEATVNVAAKLVKTGEADAMVSMGSTGAVITSALQLLGTLEGIERPIIGGPILGFAPNTVIVDVGANVDCKPHQLLNFALIGCVFARKFLNISDPSVAMLSVGVEPAKGNNLVRKAYQLFLHSGLNFIGNIEGRDIPLGRANVVVCDGFVGNVLVKFCEGLGTTMATWLKASLAPYMPPEEINLVTTNLLSLANWADVFGGGPLLGVDGVVIIGHGSSHALEVAGAINQAKLAVETDFVNALKSELAKFPKISIPLVYSK